MFLSYQDLRFVSSRKPAGPPGFPPCCDDWAVSDAPAIDAQDLQRYGAHESVRGIEITTADA
jgi:hypothetical protein